MTKKNKKHSHGNARKKAASRRDGRAAQSATSLTSFRAERAVDDVAHDFIRWFEADFGPAEEALDCLDVVKAVIAAYFDGTGAGVATTFEPEALASLLVELEESGGEEDIFVVRGMFHLYVDFLHDTGRWTGTEEDYDGVHRLVTEGAVGSAGPAIEVPSLSESEQLTLFTALPLIQRARALLTWIGEGRAVTGTGVLRLEDIEAAAACVGVAARGVRKRVPEELAGAGEMVLVQSMRQVELLHHIWATLEATEMIDVHSTKVVPFEGEAPFLNGSTEEQLEECSFFVSEFLRLGVLGGDPEEPWVAETAALTLSILIAAAAGDPPLVERLRASAANVREDEKYMVEMISRHVYRRLESWAALGLLEIDSTFRVPAVVVQCVALAFEDSLNLNVIYPAASGVGDVPAEPEAVPRKPTTKRTEAPSSSLQLKIMLKGSKPPIWRRLLVPSRMQLDALHQVIQVVFGWTDSHLHHFQTGGRQGPVYGPLTDADLFGDPPIDESTVVVSDILAREGDNLTYTYDFGDDWEHIISLEKVYDYHGSDLPRCVGGRGAGPAEDSGGIWGWMDTVEAVNDTGHERHDELREWLGLGPGQKLDPKQFSFEQADEALSVLRVRAELHTL